MRIKQNHHIIHQYLFFCLPSPFFFSCTFFLLSFLYLIKKKGNFANKLFNESWDIRTTNCSWEYSRFVWSSRGKMRKEKKKIVVTDMKNRFLFQEICQTSVVHFMALAPTNLIQGETDSLYPWCPHHVIKETLKS